ncbi:MAG: SAP domain-containing protein [Candidatus Poseidoniales archaeon]
MNTNNRFTPAGVSFLIAIVLLVVFFASAGGYEDGAAIEGGDLVFFLLLQCSSAIACLSSVVLLAYALGRPGEKVNVSMIVQDISNPAIIKVPLIENYGDSKAQSYGSIMFLLSAGAVIISILLVGLGILFDIEGDAGDLLFASVVYSCVGGIIIFFGGLIIVARPWGWFGDQQKVAVVRPKAASISSNESNQDNLSSFTVVELKGKLKQKGLAVSGKKEDLIARLKTEEVAQKTGEKEIHNCSNCQQVLKTPVGYEGRIKCPTCDEISTI